MSGPEPGVLQNIRKQLLLYFYRRNLNRPRPQFRGEQRPLEVEKDAKD